jgi:hypothetical protein
MSDLTSSPPVAPPAEAGGRPALAALLLALTAWGAVFVYRTSFVIGGRRIFCLFDDAMISMTYARNLVSGFGLNWARRGAPVEGFTHPLWTAMMVPVNLLPISLDRRPLVVQLGSLLLLLLNVVLVRRLVLRHLGRPGAHHWLPACLLTAFYYPLDFWALIGMETGLQALLTTAMVLLAFDIVRLRRDRHLALLLVSAAAVLLRLDMLLPVAAVQLWVWLGGGMAVGEPRHAGWRRGALVFALSVGGYFVFRALYFRDLLPNTYYLKLAGVPLETRLLRGGSVLLTSLRAHGLLLLLVAAGTLPQLVPRRPAGQRDQGLRRRRGRRRLSRWAALLALPAALFVLCCAYSVYVGGDAWEDDVRANRFIAFAMPLVFVLFNALCNQALSAWAARRRLRRPSRANGAAPVVRANGAAPVARANGVAPVARANGAAPVTRAAGPAPVTRAAGPAPRATRAAGNLVPRLALVAASVAALLLADGLWLQASADENWQTTLLLDRPLHSEKYVAILDQLRALQRIADPGAAVAVTWAGITAYFSDFRMVDELGYNDRHIAHGAPAVPVDEASYRDLVPGHLKWDMTYVVEEQRPDALLQIWGGRDAVLVLRRHGYRRLGDLWLDPHSPHLHLDRAAATPSER